MDQEKLIIYPKRAKGEDGHKTFSIRIKEETVERINEISVRTGHSRNELIGIFLDYALEHCSISDK
jgi:predicted DNA-binding protein